jgi:hypothetical protein
MGQLRTGNNRRKRAALLLNKQNAAPHETHAPVPAAENSAASTTSK